MSFMKSFLPANLKQKLKEIFYFRPDDPNDLLQILPPRVNNSAVKRIKGFRYPAPGSRLEARIPVRDSLDHVYDISYYVRDPRNLHNGNAVFIDAAKKHNVQIPYDKPYLPVAYKRKITFLAYDSTGLRTTKTATWQAMEKVLEQRARPDHLPTPTWEKDYDTLVAERERKGLPAPIGAPYKYKKIPENYNVVRW